MDLAILLHTCISPCVGFKSANESLRKDAVVREFETIHELEFPSALETAGNQSQPSAPESLSILQLLLDNRRMLYRVRPGPS